MNDSAGQVFDRRDYAGALTMYTLSCGVASSIGDKSGLARCTFNLGLCHSRLFQADEALALYRKALSFYQANADHASAARALNAIGVQLHRRGDLQESVEAFMSALTEADLAGSEVAVAQTHSNLGNAYKDLGNLRAAVQSLQKALEVTRKRHMDQQSAWIMNNLGGVYYQQYDLELALSYQLQSLALKEKQKDADPADLASSTMNVGLDYQFLGNYAKAAASYDRVLDLTKAGVSPPVHAMTLYNYGELLRRQGQNAAAKEKLAAAMAEAEKVPDRSTAAHSRIGLSEIAVDEGRFAEAWKLGEQALEYGRQAGETHTLVRASEVVGAALHSLGKDREAETAFLEAIHLTEELRLQLPGDQRSNANFMNERTSIYLRMAELEMGRGRPEAALSYVERSKARTLFDVLASGRADITKAMSEDERRQETLLNRSISHLHEQVLEESQRETPDRKRLTELAVQLEKARNEQRSFEIALYAAHPQLKVQRVAFEPASPGDLVAALPDSNTALLEYSAIGDQWIYLFVITRAPAGASEAQLKLYKLPVQKNSLERDVARFREQVATRDLGYRKLAISLYRDLVEPAAEQLRGKTTLVIVPDGVLWKLPFQALESSPDHYLLQDRAIFYTPSFSVLHEMQKLHEARKLVEPRLLAVQAALLPSAQREVDGLRRVYGPDKIKIFNAADADADRIKREAPNYQVLHLAAHGVFENRNPMNSYLVLAKAGKPEAGVLEARTMMDLDLRADMVVLSGCETGLGDGGPGEGLIGMSWALFIAGSPTTVASQWKVESDSTSQLMVDFHRNLHRATKAQALQQAALEVMKKPEYRHPFYWSGFVLMGEGW
ncbi:MAG TPA: CHAT domain-containing protein [Bryobacteraceae bacterium]|jgi:CHAT domain-containing protein|nr:CHAT domain-containing protein [Bryobacteraceae bacterium]